MKIPYKGKTKFCIRNLIVPTTYLIKKHKK